MEFLTLHQLSREFDKPEKVLRYKFHQLRKQNKLNDGEDFIREDFIDERHFVYKINPVTFFKVAGLAPVPLPDINGYQADINIATTEESLDNHIDTNGYQTVTKNQERDTNIDTQPPDVDTKPDPNGYQENMMHDFIAVLKEQLKVKDAQIGHYKDQLNDLQKTNNMAMSEVVQLNRRLQLVRGYQPDTPRDTNGYQTETTVDNQEAGFGNQSGNQPDDVDTKIDQNGYQSNTSEHE